jgi:hypothetical protein
MSWNDIPLVRADAAVDVLRNFSSSFRERFAFLHEMPKGDIPALRWKLCHDSVTLLISELPMNDRQRKMLFSMAEVSPETALDSLGKDAMRAGKRSVYEKILSIRRSFRESSFRRILSSRGMNRQEVVPTHFWVQVGKGGTPHLRVWAGFRSGTCSLSPIPRSFLKEIAKARHHHGVDCPHGEPGYSKVSSGGAVYAVAVEGEMRFLIPFSPIQRARYERALGESPLMNGARVRYALAPMLHETVCPLGIELPFDPYLAGGLVKDASPLDI